MPRKRPETKRSKIEKNKTIFPNDYTLQKSLYPAMIDASSKWTYRIRGWDQILSQLSIFLKIDFNQAKNLV